MRPNRRRRYWRLFFIVLGLVLGAAAVGLGIYIAVSNSNSPGLPEVRPSQLQPITIDGSSVSSTTQEQVPATTSEPAPTTQWTPTPSLVCLPLKPCVYG